MNEETNKEKEALVEKMHNITDDFLIDLSDQDVEAVMLPTVIAMICNRAGQVLSIPSQAILKEALERLKAFQDLTDVNNGKLPQNGTMDELIEKPKISLLAGVGDIVTPPITLPSTGLVTAEGLPMVDENTYGG
jgi:hypothetical protein